MDFAIVGMECILPQVAGAEDWIQKSRSSGTLTSEVPDGRWPFPADERVQPIVAPDKVLNKSGGFVTASFPEDRRFPDLDLLFDWTTHVAEGALRGAKVDRKRTALYLANLSLPTTGAIQAAATPYKALFNNEPANNPLNRFHSGLPAQRAAEELGLGGVAFALDAACASSLYAVKLATLQLETGQCDAAIAAGVQRADNAFLSLGFSQLHALSPTGVPRPLSKSADGLVIGEAAAAILIKRLDDAITDGDPIHAVIRGVGIGNDGASGNLLAPNPDGQLRALQAAYSNAGISPKTVDYFELHATGTTVGDNAELQSLSVLLDDDTIKPTISSAKSIVGHTITAAGLVGLIRAIGAVRDNVLPAQVGCDDPSDMVSKHFTLLSEPTAFSNPTDRPRRAGVSAFGFGGTNAHVVLEQYTGALAQQKRTRPPALGITHVSVRKGDRTDMQSQAYTTPSTHVTRGFPSTIQGHWVSSLTVDIARYHVPPNQLKEMLPQQLLMLELAANVYEDAQLDPSKTAVVIGMAVDSHVSEYVLRQTANTPDAITTALTSNGVQGLLPNFAANRISATLGLTGPSLTVSAHELSGAVALETAQQLLTDPTIDAVIVGAVDFSGHCATISAISALGGKTVVEGGVAMVVQRADEAVDAIATIDQLSFSRNKDHDSQTVSTAKAVFDLLQAIENGDATSTTHSWLSADTVQIKIRAHKPIPFSTSPSPEHPITITHSGPPLHTEQHFLGTWDEDTLPLPVHRQSSEEPRTIRSPQVPLQTSPPPFIWSRGAQLTPPQMATPPTVSLQGEARWLQEMADTLARSEIALANAHATYLAGAHAALAQLAGVQTTPTPMEPTEPTAHTHTPLFDYAALKRFASEPISTVFGQGYADLDAIQPSVRLPMEPLLLVSRVLALDGERGAYRRCAITTEYDIPTNPWWSKDGKAPPAVVVESGQADLMLVSFLGVDAITKGERVYRLLDCDLTFHGPRPSLGQTLRHDIRINRFATLGDKLLFYFEYDCVLADSATPVLTMRNGVAGFFTPAELSTPSGLKLPTSFTPAKPITRLLGKPPANLGADAVAALEQGNLAAAFGPSFAKTQGSPLTLASAPWRMVHTVENLSLDGGGHGLGGLHATQVLSDDDWFNACHFKDDPCMPGTLMFDGCVQALQVWMLSTGISAEFPEHATFEPHAGVTTQLRCRGQVIPGHKELVYMVQVKEADLSSDTPYAIADITLVVDGLPSVFARDVTVCIVGDRIKSAIPTTVNYNRLMEFSVGEPSRAFGSAFQPHDGALRTPRMPGPPYLTMSRVRSVTGKPLVVDAPQAVVIDYDVPEDAWYFDAAGPQAPLPLALLLEIALQPCGWLTAWQGSALALGGDVYFRNLGGKATAHASVWRDVGTLTTTATLTSTANSAGMLLTFFTFEVHAGETPIYSGETHFGYFTPESLSEQKGLPATNLFEIPEQPDAEYALPTHRADLRMFDRVLSADATAGKHGIGRYVADYKVRASDWFFTAHFHQDPVMPGSLGVEGLAQLAAWALRQRFALSDDVAIDLAPPSPEHAWTYRGQVNNDKVRLTLEVDVVDISDEGETPRLTYNGLLRCDGLPIYAVTGLTVACTTPPQRDTDTPPSLPSLAPLLDAFDTQTNTGHLTLDPQRFSWLDHHRPDLMTPALPMAFAAEIAAEVALLCHPGKQVIALPTVRATRWITASEPTKITIKATPTEDPDTLRVGLFCHHDNPRYPKLGGLKEHMFALVQVGDQRAAQPPPPRSSPDFTSVDQSPMEYYQSGETFHGPALHILSSLGTRGERGAVATLTPNTAANYATAVLDPFLLDGATHPMISGRPEVWNSEIPSGMLAYPVAANNMRIFGERPTQPVSCHLTLTEASVSTLSFELVLATETGIWMTFDWVEALVPGGPVLGAKPALRRPYALDKNAPGIQIGRETETGWVVHENDLVAPLPDTLARMTLSEEERSQWQAHGSHQDQLRDLIAGKEAVRHWLQTRGVGELHPAQITLLPMRSDLFVVTRLIGQPASVLIDHVGPTNYDLVLARTAHATTATIQPRD